MGNAATGSLLEGSQEPGKQMDQASNLPQNHSHFFGEQEGNLNEI